MRKPSAPPPARRDQHESRLPPGAGMLIAIAVSTTIWLGATALFWAP